MILVSRWRSGKNIVYIAIYISDYLVNGGEHVRGCVMPFHRNIVAFDCKIEACGSLGGWCGGGGRWRGGRCRCWCVVVAVVDHIAVVAIGISVSACNIIVPAVKTAIVVITRASVGTSCDFRGPGHQSSANSFRYSTSCNLIVI